MGGLGNLPGLEDIHPLSADTARAAMGPAAGVDLHRNCGDRDLLMEKPAANVEAAPA